MSWTPDRLVQLEALWASGKTASECARILGGGLTRHAVIGVVHRKKMQRDASAQLTPLQKVNTGRNRRSRASCGGQSAHMRAGSAPPTRGVRLPPPEPPPPPNIPPSQRVKIMDLTYDMCRYPIGDPLELEFGFCGRKRGDELTPYCEGHHALCHEGASGRRHRWNIARRVSTDESAEPDVVEQMEPEAA